MKRYETKLKKQLAFIAKGYGIGLIASLLLTYYMAGADSIKQFIFLVLFLDIFIGGIITVMLAAASDVMIGLANLGGRALASMFRGLFSAAAFGFGPAMVFWVIRLFFYLFIAMILMVFLIISFPLNFIYIVVMFFVEKKKEIPEEQADSLDNIVSGIIIVVAGIATFIYAKNYLL